MNFRRNKTDIYGSTGHIIFLQVLLQTCTGTVGFQSFFTRISSAA